MHLRPTKMTLRWRVILSVFGNKYTWLCGKKKYIKYLAPRCKIWSSALFCSPFLKFFKSTLKMFYGVYVMCSVQKPQTGYSDNDSRSIIGSPTNRPYCFYATCVCVCETCIELSSVHVCLEYATSTFHFFLDGASGDCNPLNILRVSWYLSVYEDDQYSIPSIAF